MARQILETTTVTRWGTSKVTKKIKDELFCDSIELSENESLLAKSETNDCVVRAFMVALDIPYDKAHAWVKTNFNRVNRRGTYTSQYLSNVIGKVKNGKRLTMMGWCPNYTYGRSERKKNLLVNPKYKKETGYTVKSFMEQYPKGRYFIIVKGHALALVDGVLYGNKSEQFMGFRRHIHYVVKVG
jgi:hypothetical protein